VSAYSVSNKQISITGSGFTATDNQVKLQLGDLELEANNIIQSTSSIVASFNEYPKPGSPPL